MTTPQETRLFTRDIAAMLGIQPSDWRSRVSRKYAPRADGYEKSLPFWREDTIAAWINRPNKRGPQPAGTEES